MRLVTSCFLMFLAPISLSMCKAAEEAPNLAPTDVGKADVKGPDIPKVELPTLDEGPEGPEDDVGPEPEVSGDVAADTTVTPTIHRVAADLTAWTKGPAGAFARQITDAKDLMEGPAAQGRVGDWIIGNAKARFIVQGADRHSTPCPYGGNVIDVGLAQSGDVWRDVAGEICLFHQLGRTLLAKDFEIVADGSKGPAVLAVTGDDTVNDFINVQSLLESYVPGLTVLPVNPDQERKTKITLYYVLDGVSTAVRLVMAFRNDDVTTATLLPGLLVDSGGAIEFFNPASSFGGFGYKSIAPEKLDFLAFRGAQSSYAIAPDPQPNGAPGGSYLAVSGVAGMVLGTDDVLGTLVGGPEVLQNSPAVLTLAPDAVGTRGLWIAAGDGGLSTITDELYSKRALTSGSLTLTAKTSTGESVSGHRISLVKGKAAVSQVVTDANGVAALTLPVGTYDVVPDSTRRRVTKAAKVTIEAGKATAIDVALEAQGHLALTVTDSGSSAPSPAKLSLRCVGECPGRGTSLERDVTFDAVPAGFQAVAFVGMDGKLTIPVPSGDYKVVVSRGPVSSVWPNDDLEGSPVTVEAGKTIEVAANIQKVVPTPGWLSGDFHVHAINSPDSPIDHTQRVLSFLAEGVDVLVSTDHDYVTDLAPVVKMLNADSALIPITGVELTTFDYGHYNGFPLVQSPTDLTGGALDWGNDVAPCWHPSAIFAGLQAPAGTQVVQVNHPDGGYFRYIGWDTQTDATTTSPAKFRIAPDPTATAGDTKLWSPDFTAIEVMNGTDITKFYKNGAWWVTLLSRGIKRTGTAVSDTHRAISDGSGGPRTWTWVGPGKDSPKTFDGELFATRVNEGRAVGSSGPFLMLESLDGGAVSQSVGGTHVLPKAGGTVSLRVTVRVPRWMAVDTIEILGNVTDAAPPPGEVQAFKPKPLATRAVTLAAADLKDGKYYEKVEMFELPVTQDSWFLAIVRGDGKDGKTMTPVVPQANARPFAFTNALWVDVGGDGWTPLLAKKTPGGKPGAHVHAHGEGPLPADPSKGFSKAEWLAFLDWVRDERSCSHGQK